MWGASAEGGACCVACTVRRCPDCPSLGSSTPPQLVTVGWDFKASVWQKDQLVTQLQWQENGPAPSDTPYRYQACRCAGHWVAGGHTSAGKWEDWSWGWLEPCWRLFRL